jgi:succinate dehydrogenase/fumarate reductase flavoprotein subunit
VARTVVETFAPAVEWLAGLGIPLEPDICVKRGREPEDGCCGPNSPYTRHYWITGTRAAMQHLAETYRQRGGDLQTSCRALGLLRDSHGGLAGVRASSATGDLELPAERVVLATGGFQGNRELLARYVGPWAGEMILRSNPWSVGDGFLMGLEAGAAVSRGLHAFYGHLQPAPPAVQNASTWLKTTARYSMVSVLVNLAGERFVDESICDDANARAAVRQDQAAVFALLDATGTGLGAQVDPSGLDRLTPAIEVGARVVRADTLEDLVAQVAAWGVRPTRLARTLEEFNRAMESGDDSGLEVPRLRSRRPLREPPFLAIALVPAITFTFGGLRVDGRCRVLDRHGQPIPNLLAAGVDAGGAYVESYGGGLGQALTLGYVAGTEAATPA